MEPDHWYGDTPSGNFLAITVAEFGCTKLRKRVNAFYNKWMYIFVNIEFSVAKKFQPINPKFDPWIRPGLDAAIAVTVLEDQWMRLLRSLQEMDLVKFGVPTETRHEIKKWLGCILKAKYRSVLRRIAACGVSKDDKNGVTR